jgi:heptosyltransferase-2
MIPERILIIQTAFIGDVILSTSLVETLKAKYPDASIDFLVRKGNESLFDNNPNIHKVLVWDKKKNKLTNLFKMILTIRKNRYNLLVNLQRYLSSGLMSLFSKAEYKAGFSQNPLSFCFDKKQPHDTSTGQHDIERNLGLISSLVQGAPKLPRLYPSPAQFDAVKPLKELPYITLAPASVWFTKQMPKSKWVAFLDQLPFEGNIYLIGAPGDKALCDEIISSTQNTQCQNLCGSMSLLESAALMKDAVMNYANDSAPQHICSAMNAPVTTIYCSTVPEFGFGPLSSLSRVVEISKKLDCRPCGLHGHRSCPKGHFKCGLDLDVAALNL